MYIHLWLGRHDLTLNIPLEMSFFHQGYFLKPQTEQIQRLLISEVLNETPSFQLLQESFPPSPLQNISPSYFDIVQRKRKSRLAGHIGARNDKNLNLVHRVDTFDVRIPRVLELGV